MSNTTSYTNATVVPSNQIEYIIMQVCIIPSIICAIFTLTHLLLNRNLRSTLHNHTSLILLIISILDSFFDHPFTLNFLRISRVVPSTNAMCLFWNLTNSIFGVSTYWIMAWGSTERHLLIFNSQLFNSHRGRVLFHYIPLLITTMIYPTVVSILFIFLYPCENHFNMMSLFCGYPCAAKIPSVALYSRLANQFIPVFIVTGSTLTLIVRVIKQKRQIQNNRFDWRRCRRMIIQLFTLVSLFLILALPSTTVAIVQNCCLPTFAATQASYLNFLVRFLTIFMPFTCLSSIPEIWSKLLLWKNIQVHPVAPIRGGIVGT